MSAVLRLDDVGWVPPDKTTDASLRYFEDWCLDGKVGKRPFVFGVIPAKLDAAGADFIRSFCQPKGAEPAVHGWDHADQPLVSAEDVRKGYAYVAEAFPGCRAYIPPYNRYDDSTIFFWSEACPVRPCFFLGGFDGQDHQHGPWPREVLPGVIHVPARRDVYDRALPLAEQAKTIRTAYPLAWTLHVTWDHPHNEHVARLMEQLGPQLVGLADVAYWVEKATLNLAALTAPHYLAYRFVLERIRPGWRVLDLGSKHSILPAQLALRGCTVTAADRDAGVFEWQAKHAKSYGVAYDAVLHDGVPSGDYDCCTAVWSLQHNLHEPPDLLRTQRELLDQLWRAVRPGGSLLLVNKFAQTGPLVELSRSDPLVAPPLGWYKDRSVAWPDCASFAHSLFYYEHASVVGALTADPARANAVCVEFKKKG